MSLLKKKTLNDTHYSKKLELYMTIWTVCSMGA